MHLWENNRGGQGHDLQHEEEIACEGGASLTLARNEIPDDSSDFQERCGQCQKEDNSGSLNGIALGCEIALESQKEIQEARLAAVFFAVLTECRSPKAPIPHPKIRSRLRGDRPPNMARGCIGAAFPHRFVGLSKSANAHTCFFHKRCTVSRSKYLETECMISEE
jgi:hypothetical protein